MVKIGEQKYKIVDMKKFDELLECIDVDYIKENPETIQGLIEAFVFELNARKDVIEKKDEVIEVLREKLLLANALLEGMKGNDQ